MQKKPILNRTKPRKMRKTPSFTTTPSTTQHSKNAPPTEQDTNTSSSADSLDSLKTKNSSHSFNPIAKKKLFRPFPKKKEPPQNKDNWQAQHETLNEKYQFLMAEYANYKKNNMKVIENFRRYEGQNLIQTLLVKIMDNFDRAMEQELTEKNIADFKKGIFMIYENFKNILKEVGVKEIICEGQPFDPTIHCALDIVPNENMPPEHIVHVIKKAYFFHDRLIRPAEVIVSQKSETLEQKKDVGNQ